jgi:cytochrome c553
MRAKTALVAALLAGLAAPAGAQTSPPGAASCSGCHAPARLGSPVPPIAGRDPKEIVAAMQEFRSGQRAATVMDRIAKGFSDDEVQAIAAWLAAQH